MCDIACYKLIRMYLLNVLGCLLRKSNQLLYNTKINIYFDLQIRLIGSSDRFSITVIINLKLISILIKIHFGFVESFNSPIKTVSTLQFELKYFEILDWHFQENHILISHTHLSTFFKRQDSD